MDNFPLSLSVLLISLLIKSENYFSYKARPYFTALKWVNTICGSPPNYHQSPCASDVMEMIWKHSVCDVNPIKRQKQTDLSNPETPKLLFDLLVNELFKLKIIYLLLNKLPAT